MKPTFLPGCWNTMSPILASVRFSLEASLKELRAFFRSPSAEARISLAGQSCQGLCHSAGRRLRSRRRTSRSLPVLTLLATLAAYGLRKRVKLLRKRRKRRTVDPHVPMPSIHSMGGVAGTPRTLREIPHEIALA